MELHRGENIEKLLLGSHGVTSIVSSWSWDPERKIGTLSLEGDSTATALNFRAMLDVLQLRSAVGASEGHRRILVRPDISGSAFRKDFHVREVKVYVNDAPEASRLAFPGSVKEDDPAVVTYQVPKFTDDEDTELEYEAKLVVGGGEQDLPAALYWVDFDEETRTFTFSPHKSWHVGRYRLRVRGTDSGGLSAEAEFVLTVSDFNDVPVASTLKDHRLADAAVEDTPSSYVFDAFTDEEEGKASRSLLYTAFWAEKDSAGNDRVDANGKKTFVSLPRWIVFDGSARRFTFKPDRSWHAGRYTLRVVGMDEGIGGDDATKKSAIADFVLEVLDFNDAPVASTLKDHRLADAVVEDTPSSYVFDAFTDEEEDKASRSLAYTAFWAEKDSAGNDRVDGDGKQIFVSLPTWIVFDGLKRRFTFEPDKSWHAGRYTLRVVGTEKGIGDDPDTKKSDSADFILEVLDFNDAPVASSLQDQQVDEDTTATYRFKAFTDEETPSSGLTYSAHLLVSPSSSSEEVLFEGSPASEQTSSGEERSSGSEGSVRSRRVSSVHTEGSLPHWISFDGGQRLFRFSPETGAHVGRHVLRVRARDASGKTETEDFTLHVSARNDAPEADVSIEGSLEEGRVVHLRVVGLSDEDGVPSSSRSHRYRWYESSEPEVQSSWSLISGAEGASFRLGSGQAGKYLRGVFSYMDSGGTRERVFAQSEEVVRRKSLPAVVVPIFGGEKESSSSSVSVSEEGEALEMLSRSLSQAQERLSLMRNRRGSGSGAWSFPPPRFSLPPVSSETPSQSGAPAQQNLPVEQSADAQTQPTQGAAEQVVAEDAAKQKVGGDAPEQGAAEDVSEQVVAQDATPSPSIPASRKADPQPDTELRKDLGGSELPTSVRLSPHGIHTEITFISEDEVNVQLSLAEGAPMEISVRALATQLMGDDAVRIEILDLPEGLRFDRETGMLQDTLGTGLSADGVAEVRVMLTDAQGRRMTVTLQVLSAEGLSQPEAATKLEGRTQTGEQTGSGELGGGRRDVGGSTDGAGLSDEGEGSEGSDGVGDAALEELSGDKEARSSSSSAGSGSAGALSSEGFFANFFGKGDLRLRSLSLSDFFLDLFRGFSFEKEIVPSRDISSGSADGDGEVLQTPSRSSLEMQVAELGVYGRVRSLVASLRDLGAA